MARYTTQVRTICEKYAGRENAGDFDEIDQIIADSREKIFTADYPIYEGGSKAALETKILKHYYMREIGLETVGIWKHYLNTRMLEIMPFYVDYWQNSLNRLKIDGTVDLHRIIEETGTEAGTNTGTRDISGTDSKTYGKANTRSGNISTQDATANTKTGSIETADATASTKTGSISQGGTDTNVKTGSEQMGYNSTETRTPNTTTKDKYSDTPQNTLENVDQDTYLTNYRVVTETGTEGTAKTGTDTKTFQQVQDQRTLNTTETYNQVKDQKSGTITETFNQVKDQKSGSVTETFNSVKDQESGTDTGSSESTQTDDFARTGEHHFTRTEDTTGIGSSAELIAARAKILELLVNVDMMIISDLSDLFMRIY